MSERQLPADTCLKCGETREEVLKKGYFCATLSGYETPEVDQEWDRHHWRDWSNASLREVGLPKKLWEENRRTVSWELEWVALAGLCAQNGHQDPMIEDINVCPRCYAAIKEDE